MIMATIDFRTLRANEIELRPGQISQKTGKQSLLLYKDARCDMAMLDEVVGAMNWKRQHTRDNANCIVSIWDENKKEWVSKEDTGTESKTEAEKGLASDSFKRACFNWGIGRELYTAPQIWVPGDINPRNLHISLIAYNSDREIVALVIQNEKGDIVWSMGANTATAPSATPYMDAVRAKEPSGNAKLLAEIQAADTAIKLQAIQARMDKANLSDALRDAWQKEINKQGSKLKATLTPGDGWVANADLFTEEA